MGIKSVIKNNYKFKLVLIAVLMVFISVMVTYGAFYTVQSQNTQNTINTGCLSTKFTEGSSINLANALPLSDEDGQQSSPYSFSVKNTCTLRIKYYVILSTKSTSFSNSLIRLSLNNGSASTLSSMTANTLFTIDSGYSNSYILTTGTISSNETASYDLRLWLQESTTYSQVSGQSWEGEVKVVSLAIEPITSNDTLAALGLTAKTGTPDFSTTATTDETADGLYAMADDYGTSYYFRGNVTNNYVNFAGFYWRIIRINGDGSIRMIYDGTQAYENGTSDGARYVTNSAFNNGTNAKTVSQNYGSTTKNSIKFLAGEVGGVTYNAHVGYMYGSTSGNTYAEVHANTNSSTIKTYLEDTWYKTNIVDAGYSQYISDEIFCNDRSLSSGDGIGTNDTEYGAYNRLYINKTPQLTCPQKNDAFTVDDTTNGNGALKYPVGLITADEIVLAGGKYDTGNTSYYLYKGAYYWSLSPYDCGGYNVNVFNVYSTGQLELIAASNTGGGVAPVINLSAEYSQQLRGSGTSTAPFTLATGQ